MATIHSLPTELLLQIFDHVEDRRNASRVCKSWNRIIHTYYSPVDNYPFFNMVRGAWHQKKVLNYTAEEILAIEDGFILKETPTSYKIIDVFNEVFLPLEIPKSERLELAIKEGWLLKRIQNRLEAQNLNDLSQKFSLQTSVKLSAIKILGHYILMGKNRIRHIPSEEEFDLRTTHCIKGYKNSLFYLDQQHLIIANLINRTFTSLKLVESHLILKAVSKHAVAFEDYKTVGRYLFLNRRTNLWSSLRIWPANLLALTDKMVFFDNGTLYYYKSGLKAKILDKKILAYKDGQVVYSNKLVKYNYSQVNPRDLKKSPFIYLNLMQSGGGATFIVSATAFGLYSIVKGVPQLLEAFDDYSKRTSHEIIFYKLHCHVQPCAYPSFFTLIALKAKFLPFLLPTIIILCFLLLPKPLFNAFMRLCKKFQKNLILALKKHPPRHLIGIPDSV